MLVFHDTSSFQRDQRAMRKTLLEQQAILESAAVGIVFGKAGYMIECNIRAAEMFGYARHEMEGQSASMLYPSEDEVQRIADLSGPLLRQGQSFKTELQLRRRDGSLFWPLARPVRHQRRDGLDRGGYQRAEGGRGRHAAAAGRTERHPRQRFGRHLVYQGADAFAL
jgi:PAS domain S-box-containing protein